MNRRHFLATSAAAAAALTLPSSTFAEGTKSSTAPVKTGGSRMVPIHGGKYNVWTKRVGHGALKVLLLHGGPGFNHEYFECFEDFLPQAGIEFYYYDQLGCGNSDNPDDPSLWNIHRYTDEVEQVRAALALDHFVLLGHSWGGMLAMEYALKYPKHLRALVISSMTAGINEYEAYAAKLRAELPKDVIATLDKYEAAKDYDNPAYQAAMMNSMYSQHVCRVAPWPEPLERSFRHANLKIYNYMQGPNEFVISGNLKGWERWNDLPKIKARTLVIGGRYDEMNPADLAREAKLIPDSKLHICPNGSHMAMYDDQQDYFNALLGFLKTV